MCSLGCNNSCNSNYGSNQKSRRMTLVLGTLLVFLVSCSSHKRIMTEPPVPSPVPDDYDVDTYQIQCQTVLDPITETLELICGANFCPDPGAELKCSIYSGGTFEGYVHWRCSDGQYLVEEDCYGTQIDTCTSVSGNVRTSIPVTGSTSCYTAL